MFLHGIEIDESKFIIKPGKLKKDWGYYYLQYHNIVSFFISHINSHKGLLGINLLPFVFFVRHEFELMLKYNISLKNIDIMNSHDLYILCQALNIELDSVFETLDPYECGDRFRYPYDQNGQCYHYDVPINYSKALDAFINKSCEGIDKMAFKEILNLSCRKIANSLEYNSSTPLGFGHLATDYDHVLRELVDSIQNNVLSVNDVLLPLLFTLRHNLELSLKRSFVDMNESISPKDIQRIQNNHSLSQLFSIFEKLILTAIEKMCPCRDAFLLNETTTKLNKLKELNNTIHTLDASSECFRYPVTQKQKDNNLKLNKKSVCDVLKLKIETDSFLEFAIDVLVQGGFLSYDDAVMRELLGLNENDYCEYF